MLSCTMGQQWMSVTMMQPYTPYNAVATTDRWYLPYSQLDASGDGYVLNLTSHVDRVEMADKTLTLPFSPL